jgi:hypothetical protein
MWDCITNDWGRAIDGGRSVGEEVIKKMAARLPKVSITEDWMNDYPFPIVPLEYDPELPWVIVFDTDGTTAVHHRSPYDYARAGTDTVNENVATVLRILRDEDMAGGVWYDPIHMMGMSGRPQEWRELTENWYKQVAKIPYDEFHMRIDPKANDADVKHEMVEKYIRGKYNVLMWFDDRDRVVRRLRKLGICVAQVNYGDF